MNVNKFYREIFEYSMGLDVLGLDNRFRDLVKLVEDKTLTAFSQYVPARYKMYLDLEDASQIVRKDNPSIGTEYFLHEPVLDRFNLDILGLDRIEPNNAGSVDPYDPDSAAYYSSLLSSRHNITLESVLMGAEYTYNHTMANTAIPYKRYQEFRGPRTLYLRNWGYHGQVEIILKVPWPNIVSIPESYREILINLAKMDIKIMLWNELKYMEDVATPTGNLSLKVDDWSSAERDREDFLANLRNISLPDRVGNNYFRIL